MRTRQSNRDRQDPQQRLFKQADLEMLELAAAAGEIELKYLDESGFCMWSPVSYTYFPRGLELSSEERGRLITPQITHQHRQTRQKACPFPQDLTSGSKNVWNKHGDGAGD